MPSCRSTSASWPRRIGRELDWETDDIALQNIQARVRSPSVWMLANIRGALLLSTSNRSRSGRRLCDDGRRHQRRPLADRRHRQGVSAALAALDGKLTAPTGIGPLPALSAVNEQQPTAELRPPSAKQTDEDDLMPYEVLDAIERAAIRDKQSPVEILLHARSISRSTRDAQLALWVERFFRLWCRNQWKRERYAELSPRRRKPRPENVVPVPDSLRRLRTGTGGTAAVGGGMSRD